MPLYEFECECDNISEIIAPMADCPQTHKCELCGKSMYRLYGARKFVFKPYTEENVDGSKMEFRSSKDRDMALEKHHLTYDSTLFTRRTKPIPAAKGLDWEQVGRSLKEQGHSW